MGPFSNSLMNKIFFYEKLPKMFIYDKGKYLESNQFWKVFSKYFISSLNS